MNVRHSHPRLARRGLAASLSLSATLAASVLIVGCDNSSSVDKAVVTVTDPGALATSSGTPAPATTNNATPAEKTPAPADSSKNASAAPATSAAGWGTIKGRVVFNGDAPAPKVLVAKGAKDAKDADFCAKGEIDSERLVVNKANKGVRNVLVYIPKPTAVNPEAASAAKTAEILFDQKNCTFVPHVLAAMKGATVTLKSSDPVGHNTNAVGLNNNKFNLPTQANSSQPLALKGPDKPGKVGCDIHSWMESYWLVSDNPYFAVTDADGNFEIKNVPAGDQKVVVWAEALGPGFVTAASGESIAIKAGGETTKEFTLEGSKVK